MSGGPLWTVERSIDGELWNLPRKASLVGILFYWDAPLCVRADPIEDWLLLVRECCDGSWIDALDRAGC